MLSDLKLALRGLLAAPGFATAAVLTLTIGIGAAAAVFSFVNALLLRPLPFGDRPGALVSLHSVHPTQSIEWDDADLSPADFLDLVRASERIESAGGHFSRNFTLQSDGDALRVGGSSVTPNLFSVLGVEPLLGRQFRDEDANAPGFEDAVMLSHALWQSQFGGRDDIVGRTVRINERSLTVVGVMPERFAYPERDALWVPFDASRESRRSRRYLATVARMQPDTRLDTLRVELGKIASRIAEDYPDTNRGWGIQAFHYRDLVVKPGTRAAAGAMLVSIALVLLIGCANLASLLLARSAARKKEFAIRSALGAGRWRLMRPLMMEAWLLSLVGAGLGCLFAVWSVDAVSRSSSEGLPFWLDVRVDAAVVGFSFALAFATSIAFGLWPALRSSSGRLALGAKDASQEPSATRAQSWLVGGQIAFCLTLLVGAGLMVQSVLSMLGSDLGFDGTRVLTGRLYLSGDAYDPPEEKIRFFAEAVARLGSLPGVVSAAATTSMPAQDGGGPARLVTRERGTAEEEQVGVQAVGITPTFFDALGARLLEGRAFTSAENLQMETRVCILSRELADLAGVGLVDGSGSREIGLVGDGEIHWYRVVGIAPDVHYEEVDERSPQTRRTVFLPYGRFASRGVSFILRTEAEPSSMAELFREEMRAFAPGVPLFQIQTMDELLRWTTWEARLYGTLFSAFGLAALVLACLGVYGRIAYAVERRVHEIGIRLALGAEPGQIVRMVLRENVGLAVASLGVGFVLSMLFGRALSGAIFGAELRALSVLGLAAFIAVLACLAAWLPARRASALDPTYALREE